MTGALYGFGGFKGSGKDEAAIGLESIGFARVNMSAPMDEAARMTNPIITYINGRAIHYVEYRDDICGGDYALAKEHPEVRRFLREIGGFGRKVKPSYWVGEAQKTVAGLLDDGVSVALTGTRFPAELEMVRALGGLLVWVSRPGYEDGSDTHITESSVSEDDFDVVLVNDGSIADLHRKMLLLHEG